MKKQLIKIVAVAVFTLTPFVFSGAAQAQQADCTINNTGPGSNNQCTISEDYQCSIDNENNVEIVNENDQSVTSGTANVSGNTGGGNATSGTVSNTNGTTFTITIINGDSDEPSCVVTAVTPVTPVVPDTPVQPTQGGGAAVLPHTSGDTVPSVLLTVAASLAVLSVLGVGGIALYRYYKSL